MRTEQCQRNEEYYAQHSCADRIFYFLFYLYIRSLRSNISAAWRGIASILKKLFRLCHFGFSFLDNLYRCIRLSKFPTDEDIIFVYPRQIDTMRYAAFSSHICHGHIKGILVVVRLSAHSIRRQNRIQVHFVNFISIQPCYGYVCGISPFEIPRLGARAANEKDSSANRSDPLVALVSSIKVWKRPKQSTAFVELGKIYRRLVIEPRQAIFGSVCGERECHRKVIV